MTAFVAPSLSDLFYSSILIGVLALTIDPRYKPVKGFTLLMLFAAACLYVALYSYMHRDGDWICMTVVYCSNGLEKVHLSGLIFLMAAIYITLSNVVSFIRKNDIRDRSNAP